ncbi:hypothetical protein VTJ83DRAFT_1905 [Remersonia thermophila]|uniref:Spo12-like protein n=1 Tax=Remersonia thermophila TaxID=72144 RepID=A0ABR4DIQ8_9PEZI
MATNVLAAKDINASIPAKVPVADEVQMEVGTTDASKADLTSLEHHRQVLQSKMEQGEKSGTFISPSDNIMSPCTAKLSAFRNKQVGKKVKPRSLFAQASAKKLGSVESARSNAAQSENPFVAN